MKYTFLYSLHCVINKTLLLKQVCASSSLPVLYYHIKSLIHLEEFSYMIRVMETSFSQEHTIIRSTNGQSLSHLSAISTLIYQIFIYV